jgi:hypothetical protein
MLGKGQSGPPSGILTLEFDNIANAPVANPADVADWNTLFDLPTNGNPFSSVTVTGNVVELFNSGSITLRTAAFFPSNIDRTYLVKVIDTNTVAAIQQNVFRRHKSLTQVELPIITDLAFGACLDCSALLYARCPLVTIIRQTALGNTDALTEFNYPLCTTIESSAANTAALTTGLTSINLPALVTVTGTNHFTNRNGINTPISLPLATTISVAMFRGCNNVPSFNCPSATLVGTQAFFSTVSTTNTTSVILNSATTIGNDCFWQRNGLTTINLANCTTLGTTTGNNFVFFGISGKTITCTLPVGTRTDGDAVALASANTVTFLP